MARLLPSSCIIKRRGSSSWRNLSRNILSLSPSLPTVNRHAVGSAGLYIPQRERGSSMIRRLFELEDVNMSHVRSLVVILGIAALFAHVSSSPAGSYVTKV